MPGLPTTAYGTVEGVFNEARAIINDQMSSQAGEILTDVAPFTFLMLNRAATLFENILINHGITTFTKETVLASVLLKGTQDPGIQINISDSGYFDGATNFPTPQVPTDLQEPEFLWERQTGSQENWLEMEEILDGLPAQVPNLRLGIWEWRQDAIYMPGATQTNDIRLRYTAEIVNFSTPSDVILIRGAQSALASFLAYVFAQSRGAPSAADFMGQGNDFTLQICRRNSRAKQRVTTTRRPYGGVHRVS